jgi:hypothetical protein
MKNAVPPKRPFTLDLHSATSRKTAFFMVTAVKISNITKSLLSTDDEAVRTIQYDI